MSAPIVTLEQLPAYKRDRVSARLTLIQRCDDYIAGRGLPRRKGAESFVADYNARAIDIAPVIRDEVESLNVATLYRWKARLESHGLAGLADGYGNRKGTGIIDRSEELQKWLLAIIFDHPHIRAAHLREALVATRPEFAEAVTEKQLATWLRKWKNENAQLYTFVSNPDAWKSRFKAAFGRRDQDVVRLNQLWELDSTPADLMLTDGRHSVIGIIDVYSRRMMLLVTPTSKASAIAALLRKAILLWGLPEGVRTDNGQDYRAVFFEEVLRAFSIEHKYCVPFASEQKPFIERGLGTFSHDLLELLPGFIGHNVAEQQAIRARKSFAERLFGQGEVIEAKLTAAELQRFCDDWCTAVYERRAHSGLGGQTPYDRANGWTAPARRLAPEDERGLDILLSDGGVRVVGKKGIRIEGAAFDHPDLTPLIGQHVHVKIDPTDIGRALVFAESGTFVCIATNSDRNGISRAEVANVAAARQREAMQRGQDAMKEAKREANVGDIYQAVLDNRTKEAAKIRQLPRRAETHTTEAIEGSRVAADALAEAKSQTPPTVAHVFPDIEEHQETDNDLWNRYRTLRDATERTDRETAWMTHFETTGLYRSRKQLEEYQNELEQASQRRSSRTRLASI